MQLKMQLIKPEVYLTLHWRYKVYQKIGDFSTFRPLFIMWVLFLEIIILHHNTSYILQPFTKRGRLGQSNESNPAMFYCQCLY